MYKKPNNRAISHRHGPLQQCSSMYGGISVREEHLVGSRGLRTRSSVKKHGKRAVQHVGSFILKVLWYVIKNKVRGQSLTDTKTHHKVYHTFYLPTCPPTTPPLPTDQDTTAVQQCSSMYGDIPVREENLVASGILRTGSTVRNARRLVFSRRPQESGRWLRFRPGLGLSSR